MASGDKEYFSPTKVPLDEATLRATMKVLHKAIGKQFEVDKLDAEGLRKFLHGELVAFSDYASTTRFDKVGGFELVVGKLDTCFGALVDLRNASCAVCPDQAQCLQAVFGNAKDGFVLLAKKHGIEAKQEEVVKKKEKKPKERVIKDSDMIAIYDCENPEKPGSVKHAWAQRLLSWGALSVADLVGVSKSFFPLTEKLQLVETLEKMDIGCLAKDLPEDYKAAMSKKQKKALGLL